MVIQVHRMCKNFGSKGSKNSEVMRFQRLSRLLETDGYYGY